MAHLARYATTRAGLLRVLDRRIQRWARAAQDDNDVHGTDIAEAAASARQAARAVADRLVSLGLIDDAAFAASRARTLARAGRSQRAVAAHLAARGIDSETARAALADDPEAEFAAAVAFTKRRRIGAFRTTPPDADQRKRELGMLARAGFAQDVASRALRLDRASAEQLTSARREL